MQNLGQAWIFYKVGQTQLIQIAHDLGDPVSTLVCTYVHMHVCVCMLYVICDRASENQLSWHTKFDHVLQAYCIITFCNSYNMGKRDLPDIYAQARGHIYQANPECPCYK